MAQALSLIDSPAFFGDLTTSGKGWAEDQRPKSFRQKILQLNPNGHAPLTAIMSVMGNEKVDDYEYNWFEKKFPLQGGTGEWYEDAGLTTLIQGATTFAVGAHIWFKGEADIVQHFRERQQVLVSDDDGDPLNDRVGKVIKTNINGADSWVQVELLQAAAAGVLENSDYIGVAGNINRQGSNMPDAIGYKAEKRTNFTQIFRNPYDLSRTARLTRLRAGDPLQDLRTEQLMLHGVDIEQAFLWGERSEDIIDDKPETTTRGVFQWIANEVPNNVVAFNTSTDPLFDGQAWVDAGIDFIECNLEQLFLYGSTEKLCLCGTGFLRGLNAIARTVGQINISTGATSFGLNVTRWETPYGVVFFKTHPLFMRRDITRFSGMFIEPTLMKTRIITDTKLKMDDGEDEGGTIAYDGRQEEYLAEIGLELHHPEAFMYWSGVGKNHNNYTP